LLLRLPGFAPVRHLHVAGRTEPYTLQFEDGVCSHLQTVPNVGRAGALVLASSAECAGLRTLDLRWNDLYDRSAAALLRSPHLGAVETLLIAEEPALEFHHPYWRRVPRLTGAGIQQLREHFGPRVRVG